MDTQLTLALTAPLRASMLGAQCLVWPATAARTPSSPRLTLLFLPGNPGLADYYRGYLSELHRLVGPSLEIVCVSQLGHDPASAGFSLDTEPVVSLRRQIEHKEAVLAALAGGTDRVILAGHSIGAYMALEIVRRRRTGPRIDSLHLLFPALHDMAQTPNARRLRLLLRAAAVSSSSSQRGHSQEGQLTGALLATALSAIAWLLTLVPFFVVKFLILLASPTQGPEAIRATARLLASRRAVRQCLGMACEEMDTVRTPAALGASSADGLPRIRAYWAAGDVDGWAPQSSRLYVERVLELQPHHLSGQTTTAAGTLSKRQKSFSIDEIRSARRRSKSQRLAGLVRAGASAGLAAARFGASYGLTSSSTTTTGTAPRSSSNNGGGSVRSRNPHANGSRPPVSPTRTRTAQRRPSLVAARASRRFDGSIVIEPDEVQAGADAVDLLAVDSDSDSDGDEDRTPTPRQGVAKDAMPHRASMVCHVGMPHAFVLEHSEQMARITAKWIIDDYALATPSASPSL